MNYEKIDASLASALRDEPLTDERKFGVFVRTFTPPDDAQIEEMKRLGIEDVTAREMFFSAQISSRAVSDLSHKPWVRRVSLSQVFKPSA